MKDIFNVLRETPLIFRFSIKDSGKTYILKIKRGLPRLIFKRKYLSADPMIILVRVDDRLLHGQIVCAWVPFIKADALIVASDEAAGDSMASEIMSSCGYKGLNVTVKSIEDVEKDTAVGMNNRSRAILIVGDLKDAMKIYDSGTRFSSLNIGNIHHEENGRMVSPSVIVNKEDDEIIERFADLGVRIDIRDVPTSAGTVYVRRKR